MSETSIRWLARGSALALAASAGALTVLAVAALHLAALPAAGPPAAPRAAPAAAQLAAVSAAPVTQCPAGVSPACAAWQDTNTSGGPVVDLELLDHNGAPIVACLNAGGCWVGNDHLGVTGASVFDHAIYMWSPDGVHGALVIDGQTLTGADITELHMLERAHITLADLRWLARHGGAR